MFLSCSIFHETSSFLNYWSSLTNNCLKRISYSNPDLPGLPNKLDNSTNNYSDREYPYSWKLVRLIAYTTIWNHEIGENLIWLLTSFVFKFWAHILLKTWQSWWCVLKIWNYRNVCASYLKSHWVISLKTFHEELSAKPEFLRRIVYNFPKLLFYVCN